ncbi:serine/threonine protein kinase [Streptomyces sp. R08]|uniref:non-specific serine/threonine protein kinase n=1 Tax=Streptomyces sp. R08 TaxID=3238624 RepID=A0AB39M613_9ACTN
MLAAEAIEPDGCIDGRYYVVESLGNGTGGDVYRVRDDHLDTEVALKLLTPQAGEPATWDEAQMLKRLDSKFLLPVINADVVSGKDIRYITTPVMDGGDLENAASPYGVDPLKAARWGCAVGHGLDRMHKAGLLHRDVKPGNSFLNKNGSVLLGDLGLASAVDAQGVAPPRGTMATVAPEIIRDRAPCAISTDIYSLAATVFFLLAGQYPTGQIEVSKVDRASKIIKGEFLKLRDVAPQVSQSLGTIVDRGLSLDPANRPMSALDFANQLASCGHHKRSWNRIAPHSGHDLCYEGVVAGKLTSVALICVIAAAGNDFDVQVMSGGRRSRKAKPGKVGKSQLPALLRSLFKDV